MSKLDKLSVKELNEILVEYGIDEKTIVGTGKNGRIVKADIVNAIDKYLTKEDIYDPRQNVKTKTKAKSKTAGLKTGDWVLYHDDQGLEFKAIVEKVTSTKKADIRPTRYFDNEINPDIIFNADRKFMTIIPAENVVHKDIIVTIGDGHKSTSFAIKSDDYDKIKAGIATLFQTNGIMFEEV